MALSCQSARHHQSISCLIAGSRPGLLARWLVALLAPLLTAPRAAWAHPQEGAAREFVWSWDPIILLGLGVAMALYMAGVRALWQRAGIGRGLRTWQVVSFSLGVLMVAVALLSPLAAVALTLLSAHMVQHLVLILVAAPLLALGAPFLAWLWVMPFRWRRTVSHRWQRMHPRCAFALLFSPTVVWVIHTAVFLVWHVPALYQATLVEEALHAFEHISFLVTAVLFWWSVLPGGPLDRLVGGAAALYLFAAAMQGSVLGALMTFSRQLWYPAYVATTVAWGFEPLTDQQLAGLIMWVPAGAGYTLVAGILFLTWLQATEQEERSLLERANSTGNTDTGLNPAHGSR